MEPLGIEPLLPSVIRFETEREIRLPAGNDMASPFSLPSRDFKTLGPIVFGVAQARGEPPLSEHQTTEVAFVSVPHLVYVESLKLLST